ncbi:amino acid ABC transporter membrane protein 2, PAAT family [Andreprevotia lacus DSM 23236]|jgi:polar amino acid transport system permease protein|uniref:Amino acid ABC transporter membrane protein 2, PAAT family n=1 Tax=Andreprevotia lacus DSM 23236 TaxID=1121001 RepID=A0A1W1XPB6_9NEIS|nr:ABC transporter permease subunit [Andreprevotia lacus]SMC25736.1 amino acid ABC transporter membrane protein 2, PAAT family [Andreprevotia lacus DSM 23236]
MNTGIVTNNLLFFLVGAWPAGPLGGLALTVLLGAGAGLLASALGLAWGIALAQCRGWLHLALHASSELLRAIPVLLLMFWCYFLLPIVFKVDIPGVLTVLLALALVSGAYLAHAVAAGIAAVPSGQREAALACGLTPRQALRFVLLPQALRTVWPSFVNQCVTLLKDTSLAYIVGVAEFTFVANQVNNREQVYPLEVFSFVALVYLLLCSGVQWLGKRLLAGRHAPKSG